MTTRLTFSILATALIAVAAACTSSASDSDSTTITVPDSIPERPPPQPPATTSPSPVADASKPTPDIDLNTDKARYRAGDSVSLLFINKTGTRFAFNPCPRVVERQVKRAGGSDWMPVVEPPRRCTMEAWILKAHEARTAKTVLPTTLDAGSVRIVVAMTKEGMPTDSASVAAISRVFTVGP